MIQLLDGAAKVTVPVPIAVTIGPHIQLIEYCVLKPLLRSLIDGLILLTCILIFHRSHPVKYVKNTLGNTGPAEIAASKP